MRGFECFGLKNVGFSNNWAEFRGAIILANDHFSDHFRFRFWGEPKWARAIILADDHFSGYVLYNPEGSRSNEDSEKDKRSFLIL